MLKAQKRWRIPHLLHYLIKVSLLHTHLVRPLAVLDDIDAALQRGEVEGGSTFLGSSLMDKATGEVIDAEGGNAIALHEGRHGIRRVLEGDALYFAEGKFHGQLFAGHLQHSRRGEGDDRLLGKGDADGTLRGCMDVQRLLGLRQSTSQQTADEENAAFYHNSVE